MPEFLRILFLQADHNATVVTIGCALLGLSSGLIGSLALLRKRSLMGDALAHATLPGIACAFLAVTALVATGVVPPDTDPKSLPVLLLGAAISGVLGVLCVHAITRWSRQRIKEDAAIGIVLSVFFGIGTVLLSYIQQLPTGTQAGLKTYILGQPAAMSTHDAWLLAIVASLAGVITLLFYKEFRLLCFDESFARVQGWPAAFLDLLLMGLVVLVTVVGLQAVGLILVVALVITPAAAARFWTDRFSHMLLISAAIGLASGHLGVAISAQAPRLPAGAIIVLVATSLFLLSALFAPRHGLIKRLLAQRSLTRRIHLDHVLRSLSEAIECMGESADTLSLPVARVALEPHGADRSIAMLSRRGLAEVRGTLLTLTPAGSAAARTAVRNHRLWEHYLVTHADIAPSHVDRAADMIEHVLSPELIRELEQSLAHEQPGSLGRSIHPIDPALPPPR